MFAFQRVAHNSFLKSSSSYQNLTTNVLKNSKICSYSLKSYFASIDKLRNIGISAHIDSGKTTFTERVLFYGGRIKAIHEVKGSDNVGAKMDFMELEREKGITIQSAATHLTWKDHKINVIDTPGHVDFTIEVERALRVLDGAVLLICGASGVQPQTLTVDRQMKRYEIPRIIFINKLDRMGANPWSSIDSVRTRLSLHCAAVQYPIGMDMTFKGLIDLIKMRAFYFDGKSGEFIREEAIPEDLLEEAQEKRQELIEKLGEVDPEIEDLYLNDKPITEKLLKTAIRRRTLDKKFIPVFMGSAYKNKGVQLALDGVCDYLPNPKERVNVGYLLEGGEEKKIELSIDNKKPFVGLAFKLEENKFGQLTYVRVYQGKMRRGDFLWINKQGKKAKIARMVRMHANEMEEIQDIEAGDIFAIFGVECASGETFTEGDGRTKVNLSSMFVPQPVMSLTIRAKRPEHQTKFHKALSRFTREDPTFHVTFDKESEDMIISGMGELHLQIYAERIRREFEIEVELGEPCVNYRETIGSNKSYDYLHKKQSGGAGQYARVIGHMEPIPMTEGGDFRNQFVNEVKHQTIPSEYIPACEKSFNDCLEKGPLTGYPVVNVKYVLSDGAIHVVDSSTTAFAIATKYAFRQCFLTARPQILEPIMTVEITVPRDAYQGAMQGITKRGGLITGTETRGELFIINATVALSHMFGYSTDLRGISGGQGEFTMEYKCHEAVSGAEVPGLIEKFEKKRRQREADEEKM
jgi:elongation factor G